jgi:transketolase
VLTAGAPADFEAERFAADFAGRAWSVDGEQALIALAAGLAREGFAPLVHGFASLLTRRGLDAIALAVAYPNLRVRLFGFAPGVASGSGPAYQAIDDLALMRALPNLTVLECGDATEVESCLDVAHRVDGPVYLRMLRGEVLRLFSPRSPMQLGQARVLSTGGDLAVLSSGICTEEVLRAAGALAARGVALSHLHVSTLKPFADPELIDTLASVRHGVITLENHSVVGGLGSAAAELIAEQGLALRLIRLGLPDRFAHAAGRDHLLAEQRIDAAALVAAVEELLDRSLRIGPSDLAPRQVAAEDALDPP